MAALPEKTSFTDTAVTQQGFRNAMDQLRDYLAGVLDEAGTPAAARAKLGLSDAATTSVASIHNGLIPVGTRMVFHQAAAPAGWQQVTSVNDRVLRVVSGSGGGQGGGWTISGLSASRGSLSVAGHSLTINEMPAHSHTVNYRYDGGGGTTYIGGTRTGNDSTNATTSSTGMGQPHAHGLSGAPSVSHDGSWRPAYTDVIVCERN